MCHAKVDWSKDRERQETLQQKHSLLPKRRVYLEIGT